MSKVNEANELYNNSKNLPNEQAIKLLKKAIKYDKDNLDIRLYYISRLDNPKKKMNEYDILINDELKKIDKTDFEFQDIKNILVVGKAYVKDAFKLGYITEGIDCGVSCLKIDRDDHLSIRYDIYDTMLAFNRLNDFNLINMEFISPIDKFASLLFNIIIEDFNKSKDIYNELVKENNDLLLLLKNKSLDNENESLNFNQTITKYESEINEFFNNL